MSNFKCSYFQILRTLALLCYLQSFDIFMPLNLFNAVKYWKKSMGIFSIRCIVELGNFSIPCWKTNRSKKYISTCKLKTLLPNIKGSFPGWKIRILSVGNNFSLPKDFLRKMIHCVVHIFSISLGFFLCFSYSFTLQK